MHGVEPPKGLAWKGPALEEAGEGAGRRGGRKRDPVKGHVACHGEPERDDGGAGGTVDDPAVGGMHESGEAEPKVSAVQR